MTPPGTLWGIGTGPGDPELLTRKAARLIAAAPCIAYPALPGTGSFARAIVETLIAPGTREIAIELPMTRARAPAQAAYDAGAARLAEVLQAGSDVALLCEGDPLFYGSFMYLQGRLAGRFPVQVVPGVTSLTACAAAAALPLAARNGVVTILPGPLPDAALAPRIAAADTVVLMKVGRHLPRLRALLGALGLAARATYVERASLPQAQVLPLAEAPDPAPYFSTILVVKAADPWLS